MTDEAYDAQTLATSARIERLHVLRFGRPQRTWTCERGHVNRDTPYDRCASWSCARARRGVLRAATFAHYGASDTEALIFSRAN